MSNMLKTALVAAAVAGFAGAAQAQVPSAESMGTGVTPRAAVEGRVNSTTRQGAMTPDDYAGRRSGRVYYSNSPNRPYVEGRVASTPRMNAVTPDQFAGRGRAWTGPYMAVDSMETGTVVGSALGTAPGPSREWKWAQCSKLYPTFDPQTGTFMGEDGLVHLCQ